MINSNGMKSSTIKVVLQHKLEDWFKSITDEALRTQMRRDVMVCGGAIASLLLGEKVNDYDVYFKTRETALAVAEYYVDTFNNTIREDKHKRLWTAEPVVKQEVRQNSKGESEDRVLIYVASSGVTGEADVETIAAEDTEDGAMLAETTWDEIADKAVEGSGGKLAVAEEFAAEFKALKGRLKYRPVFFSENAITLSDSIQVIIRFFGDSEAIYKNFDYAHAICHFDLATNKLHTPEIALKSLLSKSLVYKGSLYPIASIFRIRKFLARGWRITAGQMLKIIWQVNDLDLANTAVLKEQLLGVDQRYMSHLIHELSKTNGKVDATYLGNLIDEIFE